MKQKLTWCVVTTDMYAWYYEFSTNVWCRSHAQYMLHIYAKLKVHIMVKITPYNISMYSHIDCQCCHCI